MGDDAQSTESTATTLTEGTAPPATAQEGGASSEATPTGSDSAAAASEENDIWAKLAELDPEEIIRRNPRLQGKVGSLAQQQAQREAQRLRSEWEQQRTAEANRRAEQAKRERLRQLAEADPDRLATEVVADLARTEQEERERERLAQTQNQLHAQLAQELNSFYQRPIVQEIWKQADAETQQKLNWTNYDDIPSFLEAAADIVSEFKAEKKVSTKAEELAKKRFEALVKESKIESVKADAEQTTDLNLDSRFNGQKIFTREEIKAMPLEEYRKNKSAIRAQVAAGLIK